MSIVYKNGTPYLEELNLTELTEKIETPFYIYSQKKIVDRYNLLKNSLNKNIYFSVKANSNQAILYLLKSLGAGADVVSYEEMVRALKAGISSSKIIFEGVGKSTYDIQQAIKYNIKQINAESIEELKIIENIAQSLNKKLSVGFRINPNINANTLDKISTGRQTDKFGIDFDQISDACNFLQSSNYIELNGLSCHIGSQIFEISVYAKMFDKIREAIEILKSQNIKINNLDLGGGFGISYENENNNFNIIKFAELVNKHFNNLTIELSFEPGRYLLANSGFLITKILTTKQNGNINYLIIDAGMQTFLRPALYNTYHKILPFIKVDNNNIYTIAGPICESSDILAKNINLPLQKREDFLILCDVGAYGSVMSSNYNSKCLPAEILINNNKYAIIREKENIENKINRDKIPNWL